MTLVIDRMALDDVGANPGKLAHAILEQIGHCGGRTPIEKIAAAVDIIEIRQEPLHSFEAALVTPPERGFGKILVNENSPPRRRRFSIAHELGHYLNPWHVPTSPIGFRCQKRDFLLTARNSEADRHRRQEAEANAFAIALLAPASLVRNHFSPRPDLVDILAVADDLDISREAAARRYVEVRDEALAVIFSRDNRLIYSSCSSGFPLLASSKNDVLPDLPRVTGGASVSEVEYGDPADWLRSPNGDLTVQTLVQQDSRAITLLHHTIDDDDEEDPVEDSFERYSRFSRAS